MVEYYNSADDFGKFIQLETDTHTVTNSIEWPDGSTTTTSPTTATDFEALDDVDSGPLTDRPASGTPGNWYFTTDNNGVFYDNGVAWQLVVEHPANITASDLGFDPATQTELNNHAGSASAHHTKTTSQGDLTDFSSDAAVITVSSTAPSSPSTNDIWIDTS
jgi:hypothetical protein